MAAPGPRRPGWLKRLRYRLEAGVLLGLLGLIRLIDVDRASDLAGRIGRRAAGLLDRPTTRANIRIAYPDADDDRVRQLLGDMGENFGRTLAESAHLDKFMTEAGRARFRYEGLEHLEAATARQRPLLFISGHFGNFELAFVALHHLGLRTAAVTRRPNNPYVADWFAENRARLGFSDQLPKGADGTRQMAAMFRRGGNVGMLVDQHLAQGVPVPLFGRPAMTVHSPAILAIDLDLSVVPFAVRRDQGVHFTVVFHPPILPPGSGNEGRDVLAMTAALNAFVEAEVRARPGHWLWMHRRWKPVPELSRRALRIFAEAGAEPGETGVPWPSDG